MELKNSMFAIARKQPDKYRTVPGRDRRVWGIEVDLSRSPGERGRRGSERVPRRFIMKGVSPNHSLFPKTTRLNKIDCHMIFVDLEIWLALHSFWCP